MARWKLDLWPTLDLLSDGGLYVETLDSQGQCAARTLILLDGDLVHRVRKDLIDDAKLRERHFDEVSRKIGALFGELGIVGGVLAFLRWITLGSFVGTLLSALVLFAKWLHFACLTRVI